MIREKKITEGKNQYKVFQQNWKIFSETIVKLKIEAEEIQYSKRLLKMIIALETLIVGSVQAPVMSVKPSPPIDFFTSRSY